MKTILIWLALVLALVGCTGAPTTATEVAEPTAEVMEPTAETMEPTAPSGMSFSGGGVTFAFDPAVADSATLEVVPATPADEALPYWGKWPEHRKVTLAGYELVNTYHQPAITIYPVDAYAAASPEAGTAIEALRTLLTEQPAAPEAIPVLPLFNAMQVTRAQVRYLEFEGGTGVRFVTQYGQAALPISNQEIFYTFQGLMSDGRYFISAILPVAAPGIAPTDDIRATGEDFVAFPLEAMESGNDPAGAMEAYVAAVTERLNALDPATFTPSLTLLDGMMQSLRVE